MNASVATPHEDAMKNVVAEDVLASRAWADALIGAIEWAKEEGRRQRSHAEASATQSDGSIEGDAA